MNNQFDGLKSIGSYGIVVDNVIVDNISSNTVYVSSSDELTLLANELPVGSLAIQYGFTHIWQLKPDKTWIEI